MAYITILLIITLIHIVYSDFRELKINVFSILAAGILCCIRYIKGIEVSIMFQAVLINMLFTSILLGVLSVYCIIKQLKFTKVIGWGDIIFLVVALGSMSPLNYIIYILLSSFLGIAFYAIVKIYRKKTEFIPFAGIMAANLITMLIFELTTRYSALSDAWLIEFLI